MTHAQTIQPDRWLARACGIKLLLAIVVWLLLATAICHAQRGTLAFVQDVRFPADRLTWIEPTNNFLPTFTEVQLQTGDMVWRTKAIVSGTNTVLIARDTRTARYRIRTVYFHNGQFSTWVYKSTK